MPLGIKPSCVICAWRTGCKKQFSITDPSRCPDFSPDVSVKDLPGRKGAKVLVEGPPGCGKTTLTERLITRLGRDRRVGGFFTREIREHGGRVGFRVISVDKQEGVLAHEKMEGAHKVGRYTVNMQALEEVGVSSVERALREDDVIVIDEIGKMELFSRRFREMVEIALAGEKPLFATVARQGPPFLDEIKRRQGVRLLALTPSNLDEVLEQAVGLIGEGA